MVCNGPGDDSTFKPCGLAAYWMEIREPYPLAMSKRLWISRCPIGDLVESSPFFSSPPYVALRDNLRDFLQQYRMKKELTRSGELDLFPELESIYETCLSYFDAAIADLERDEYSNPPLDDPKVLPQVPTTTHPTSPSSFITIPAAVALPLRRIQPPRRVKRGLQDDDSASEPKPKKKISAPSLESRPPLDSKNRPHIAKPPVSRPIVGFRWSGRLRAREPTIPAAPCVVQSNLGKRQSSSQGSRDIATKRRKARK